MMTVTAIDCIIHHATIIEIEGESYRKKQGLKNNQHLVIILGQDS